MTIHDRIRSYKLKWQLSQGSPTTLVSCDEGGTTHSLIVGECDITHRRDGLYLLLAPSMVTLVQLQVVPGRDAYNINFVLDSCFEYICSRWDQFSDALNEKFLKPVTGGTWALDLDNSIGTGPAWTRLVVVNTKNGHWMYVGQGRRFYTYLSVTSSCGSESLGHNPRPPRTTIPMTQGQNSIVPLSQRAGVKVEKLARPLEGKFDPDYIFSERECNATD